MIVAAEIVCCSLDGSSCSRKYKGASGADICRSGDGYHLWENPGDDDRKVTWNEANLHCLSEGKRLCNSQEELDKCCKTGCFYDNQLVWSSVKEGMKKSNQVIKFLTGFNSMINESQLSSFFILYQIALLKDGTA